MTNDNKMRPMMILPPNTLSKEDVKKLNNNGICTVVAKNPEKIKFVDPIPSVSNRSQMEQAAINLSRRLLTGYQCFDNFAQIKKSSIIELYVELLVKGTSLDPQGTKEEQELRLSKQEREDELRRLARLDAKKEHERRKAAKKASQEVKPVS